MPFCKSSLPVVIRWQRSGGEIVTVRRAGVRARSLDTRHMTYDCWLHSDDPDTRTGKKDKSGSKSKKDKGQKSKAAAARVIVSASSAAVAVRGDRGIAAPS